MTLRELLADYKVSPDALLDSKIGSSLSGIAISAHMSGGFGDIDQLEITVQITGIMGRSA